MVAGKSLMGKALAPGSLPYGERRNIEQSLPAASRSGDGGGTAAPPVGTPANQPYNFNPIDALSNGIEPPRGSGRLIVNEPTGPSTRQQRLMAIAREANNPALRHVARSLLMRDARRG